MSKSATKLSIHTIDLDIAKNSISVHHFDSIGNVILMRDLKRGQVLHYRYNHYGDSA